MDTFIPLEYPALLGTKPERFPRKLRDECARFSYYAVSPAVAAQYSIVGLRCTSQYGLIVNRISLINQNGATRSFAVGKGSPLTIAEITAVGTYSEPPAYYAPQRRDRPMSSDGKKGELAQAKGWIGSADLNNSVPDFAVIDGPMFVPTNSQALFEVPIYVARDENIFGWLANTVNQAALVSMAGIEFYSEEARNFFLDRMT